MTNHELDNARALIGDLHTIIAKRDRDLARAVEAMHQACCELGVPGPEYPAPVANAYEILGRCLGEIAGILPTKASPL